MKSFDSYVLDKDVVSVKKDIALSKSLIEDGKRRFSYHIDLKIDEKNSKFIFENCYEAVRELLDALMAINGFRSYSHQAPIVFAKDKDILNYKEAVILDILRDKRNKSKYYGKNIDAEFVESKIDFFKKIFRQILKSVEEGKGGTKNNF